LVSWAKKLNAPGLVLPLSAELARIMNALALVLFPFLFADKKNDF
jgi:hypothetical protein